MTNEILNKAEIYKKYDFQMNISTLDDGYLFSLLFENNPIAEITRSDFDELDSLAILFRYAGDAKHKNSLTKATTYYESLDLILQSASARKDSNLIQTMQFLFSQANQSVYSSSNDRLYINSLSSSRSENKILTLHIFDEITLENLRDKFMLVYYDLNQLKTKHNSDNKVAVLETTLQMPEK